MLGLRIVVFIGLLGSFWHALRLMRKSELTSGEFYVFVLDGIIFGAGISFLADDSLRQALSAGALGGVAFYLFGSFSISRKDEHDQRSDW